MPSSCVSPQTHPSLFEAQIPTSLTQALVFGSGAPGASGPVETVGFDWTEQPVSSATGIAGWITLATCFERVRGPYMGGDERSNAGEEALGEEPAAERLREAAFEPVALFFFDLAVVERPLVSKLGRMSSSSEASTALCNSFALRSKHVLAFRTETAWWGIPTSLASHIC
jgi:hypothetical protein